MPRRVELPGAEEFFRPTSPHHVHHDQSSSQQTSDGNATAERLDLVPPDNSAKDQGTKDQSSSTSGRVRHDEKITIYLSSDELLGIEQARLGLRAHHGITVDRGRLVREAIGIVLSDLEARGADSDLVARLKD